MNYKKNKLSELLKLKNVMINKSRDMGKKIETELYILNEIAKIDKEIEQKNEELKVLKQVAQRLISKNIEVGYQAITQQKDKPKNEKQTP